MKELEKIIDLENNIREIDAQILSLKLSKIVQKYIELCNKKEKLNKEIDDNKKKYLKKLHNKCSHELLFLTDCTTDNGEEHTYYECICMECGLKLSGRISDFKNNIVLKGNYIDIYIDYNYNFKDLPEQEKKEKLIEKYRINKENIKKKVR